MSLILYLNLISDLKPNILKMPRVAATTTQVKMETDGSAATNNGDAKKDWLAKVIICSSYHTTTEAI